MDGVLQSRGRRPVVVLPSPAGRGYSFLASVQGAPPSALRPPCSNLLGELATCHRTGIVEEYQDRFQALLPRAGRLDEAQHVQLFTTGLQPLLSHDVEIHNPQSLAAAMSLSRKIELRNTYAAPPVCAPQRDRPLLLAPPARLALLAPPADKNAPATITVEGRPVKRLT